MADTIDENGTVSARALLDRPDFLARMTQAMAAHDAADAKTPYLIGVNDSKRRAHMVKATLLEMLAESAGRANPRAQLVNACREHGLELTLQTGEVPEWEPPGPVSDGSPMARLTLSRGEDELFVVDTTVDLVPGGCARLVERIEAGEFDG